jgi:hypothetical protein
MNELLIPKLLPATKIARIASFLSSLVSHSLPLSPPGNNLLYMFVASLNSISLSLSNS